MTKPKRYYSLRAFAAYMSRHKLKMAVVFCSFLIADILIAVLPIFIGKLIGSLAADPVNADAAMTYVWILTACSIGHVLAWHGSEILYLKLLNPTVIAYENVLFRHVIKSPYPYFVDKFTGKLSSYVTTVSRESKDFMEKVFWNYVEQAVSLVAVSLILASINWQTGAIFAGGLLLMLIVGKFTIRKSIKYEKQWTDVDSNKNGKIIDAIANFVNVKSFQKETAETETIRHEQDKTIKAAHTSFIWSIIFWASVGTVVRALIWPVTIAFNVHLYLQDQITLAELTTVLSVILLFSSFIWNIVWNVSEFSLRLARMEEAYLYLFGNSNIVKSYFAEKKAGTPQLAYKHGLALEHINFQYPDNHEVAVLSDIHQTIKKGEKIGVVGRSGSGKTTLTKLLLGYYPAEDGQVLIDGTSVATEELAQLISYVPQDTSLFHRSIAENIAYATDRKVSRKEIITAAKQAHAHEFISQITGGYDALVGERGVKLSAGQRQRIAIARAYLDNKPILILDEATSALDSESEILVQQALEALWHDKTVIAIAHRLSTLRNMDRIIVMDGGKIIEQGTHEELLAARGTYAKLWKHQSGGFIEE